MLPKFKVHRRLIARFMLPAKIAQDSTFENERTLKVEQTANYNLVLLICLDE